MFAGPNMDLKGILLSVAVIAALGALGVLLHLLGWG